MQNIATMFAKFLLQLEMVEVFFLNYRQPLDCWPFLSPFNNVEFIINITIFKYWWSLLSVIYHLRYILKFLSCVYSFSSSSFLLDANHKNTSSNVTLQVVRHFWERNDIKGAINALRKLPDHSVGIRENSSCLVDFLFIFTF